MEQINCSIALKWIERELIELNKDKLDEDVILLKTGANALTVLEDEPQTVTTSRGPRKLLTVTVGGEYKKLKLNPKNPVYRQILEKLAKGEHEVVLIKSGIGKDTKYNLEGGI